MGRQQSIRGALLHRDAPTDDEPDEGFAFVGNIEEAVTRAREAAGGKDVSVIGGAEVIPSGAPRRARRRAVDLAPVVLGRGKRLFGGFEETVSLEHIRVRQSPFATHITFRVTR